MNATATGKSLDILENNRISNFLLNAAIDQGISCTN